MRESIYGDYRQKTDVPGYALVNRQFYFYDDQHDADPASVLKSIQQWIKKNPTLDIADIHVHVGWDGEVSFVEAVVSFVDPAWAIGAFAN